jgi:hypothetical protein
MAFDFPASPTTGQQITMPDGTVRLWDGTKWVAGAYGQSGFVPLSGGTMSGPLVLSGNPAVALGAATKQYADIYATNDGRNLIHNGLFAVAQRGAGPWMGAGNLTLDRWQLQLSLDTMSVVQAALSDTQRAQIGDEAAYSCLSNAFVGNAGAGAYDYIAQSLEDVRRLAGKTVTVSFYASCNAGALKLGVSLDQFFGSGGSPSAPVTGNGQAVTLAVAFARYSLTFAIPSWAGKTVGTNSDSRTSLNFWFSSGTTQATRTGNIGVQTGTINLWGVQLEIGSVATPLEKLDPRMDLANCQRFYRLVQVNARVGASGPQTYWSSVGWEAMRATPTVLAALAGGASSNANSISLSSQTPYGGMFGFVSVGAGDTYASFTFPLSADL